MQWPSFKKESIRYWLKIYLLYLAFEACIQLFFYLTLNIFDSRQISDIEFHFLMWIFQCVFVLPIWYVAYLFRRMATWQQMLANITFFIIYSFFWHGPAMQWISMLHIRLQQITQPDNPNKIVAILDTWPRFYYQLLKHAWRVGWFFVANYFYHYKREEKQRLNLLVANKELQLNLIKWHLNPEFYFKTINTIAARAKAFPEACSGLILNLSKVMEYVIYRSREKLVPVTEELSFLQNYIDLQNLDNENGKEYKIIVSGDHSKLSIIPLLLVSLLEGRLQQGNNNGIKKEFIGISFSGKSMELNGGTDHKFTNPALHPSLQMRLEEFYANKYKFTNGTPEAKWFAIQLTTE